jgi:deoxyribodipyrimidine photolyase-related protein
MTNQHPDQWTLYHSRLSFSLNAKLLSPKEVIAAAVTAYEDSDGQITLPQIEGFVRQILGWREYVRCVYWQNMPEYGQRNELNADRDLPEYFWTGDTKMECLKQAIGQSLKYAYAHHIQRLMITGNFSLLTGIHPDQVDDWYLGIYIDAIEWVEMPNTRGMSQFADGGWVATKPYSAGGNYVNKMSDYCKSCHYKIKEKSSDEACPLNSLYWLFMNKHRDRLGKNPRIGMVYRNWDKQTEAMQTATLVRGNWCLENIEAL